MDETHKHYLKDLGYFIREGAEEARATYLAEPQDRDAFNLGYLMGYRRVVTLMQQQATAFGMPLEDICLENIPEEFFFVRKDSNTEG